MSVQITPLPKRRRKFWFIPRFSLRTFLVLVVLLAVSIAPLAQSTRRQMQVCERLEKLKDVSFLLKEPPTWLRFLPKPWLKLLGGHWCQRVKTVRVFNRFDTSSQDSRAKMKDAIQLAAQLPHLDSISISIFDREPDLTLNDLTDCYSLLRKINGLRCVSLSSLRCDLHLAALPHLQDLKVLNLYSSGSHGGLSGLSDTGVLELRKFPRLQRLDVSGEKMVGQSLSTIAALESIREVAFDRESRFATSDLACFSNHPTLERFDSVASYDDDAIRIFMTCPNLRSLNMSAAPITSEGFDLLSRIEHLEQLNISGTPINDSEFSVLSNCKSLKELKCSNCKLTDAIGPSLAQFRNLELLDLSYTQVSEAILPYISSLKNISRFDIPDFPVHVDTAIALMAQQTHRADYSWGNQSWRMAYYHFGNEPQYERSYSESVLVFSGLSGIRGRMNQVRELAGATYIGLSGTDVDDSDLQTLASACDIRSLDISKTAITLNGLQLLNGEPSLDSLTAGPFEDLDQALGEISSLSTLKSLSIVGLDALTQSRLESLKKLQGLNTLNFSGCELDSITIASLCELPSLQDLYWSDDQHLDHRQIEKVQLQQARQNLGIPGGIESQIVAASSNNGRTISHGNDYILVDEREIDCLANASVSSLSLKSVPLSRHGIDSLVRIDWMYDLDLSGTNISDELIKPLSALKSLGWLDLSNTSITDATVDTLIQLKELRVLNLANTGITDAGLSKLFQSLDLHTLNLSGTKTSLQAWDGLNRDTSPVAYQLVLENVSGAPEIFKRLPSKWLPYYIATQPASKGLHSSVIKSIRHECSGNLPQEMELNPDVLRAWPIEEVLQEKGRIDHLHICNTGKAAQILRVASRLCPKVKIVEFNNEQFDDLATYSFSENLCTVQFKNCSISSAVLNSLAQAPCLKRITFESCELGVCSLEPLAVAKALTRISRKETDLTAAQEQTWMRLNSSLKQY